jgi:hypothetical protein
LRIFPLLAQGQANEFLPEKQGEDLVGENVSDNLILEAGDTMERPILYRASFFDSKLIKEISPESSFSGFFRCAK